MATTQDREGAFRRYDKSDKLLINTIKDHTQEELNKLIPATRALYQPSIKTTNDYLLERVDTKTFFDLDSLQDLVDTVANNIVASNQLSFEKPVILIGHDSYAQAVTYINGIFEISIGALSIIENEDQLAFILAHEFSHREKYHIANAIYDLKESDFERTVINEFQNIRKGKSTLEGLQAMQSKYYSFFRLSRSSEMVSDSLAIVYMNNAGYEVSESLRALTFMGYRYIESEYETLDLLNQLFRERFPLRSYWLDSGLSIFNRKPDIYYVFETDSISTHPDLDLRIEKLADQTGYTIPENLKLNQGQKRSLIIAAIDGAYTAKQFEVCIYLALHLMFQDSDDSMNDSFLVSMICKVLLDLHQARYDNTPENNFDNYVNRYTVDYSNGLKQINYFLKNLDSGELLEVGYQFLNKPTNFNPAREEHYHLLYQFSTLTDRKGVAAKIKEAYFEEFPLGDLRKEFK